MNFRPPDLKIVFGVLAPAELESSGGLYACWAPVYLPSVSAGWFVPAYHMGDLLSRSRKS